MTSTNRWFPLQERSIMTKLKEQLLTVECIAFAVVKVYGCVIKDFAKNATTNAVNSFGKLVRKLTRNKQ
jgi:hypothetical protein